jgi:hypothetical protein
MRGAANIHIPNTEKLNKLREEKRKKRRDVTLLRAPIRSVSIFALVLGQYVWQGVDYVRLHLKTSLAFAALLALLFVLNHTPGAHTEVLLCVLWCGVYCALLAINITPGAPFVIVAGDGRSEGSGVEWFVVGPPRHSLVCGPRYAFPSSLPLTGKAHRSRTDGGCCALAGTGLHTFVLYLGPLIAKATIAATECNSTSFELYGPDRFLCPSTPLDHDVRFTHTQHHDIVLMP